MKYEDYHNLIKWNIGRWTNKFRHYNIDQYELESLANITFVYACRRFDPTRGVKFSTYFLRAINNEYGNLYKKVKKKRITFTQCLHAVCYDIQNDEEASFVWSNLKYLPKRDAYVLSERCKGKTCKAIGEKLGITKQAISLIEQKAIEKMKFLFNESSEISI